MQHDTAKESIARRYRILDTLGQGGMGTVLLAKDRLGGLVALKRLTASTDQWDRAIQAREEAEAPTPELFASGLGGRVRAPASPLPATRVAGPEPLAHGLAATAPTVATMATMASGPGARDARDARMAMASTLWHVSGLDRELESGPSPTSEVHATHDPRGDEVAEMLRLTLAREFRLLSSLRHPNIISVLDYGFDDELRPYFTMELLDRAESIMRAGAAAPEARVGLLAQTLQALAYLHRRGVIHRDLKPGNVMVVDGRVKVLDFGVSTLREPPPDERDGGHFIVGTLAYMAPELLGGAPASEASDLYAVGVIAYELFSGRYPFDITSMPALRDAILHRRPDLAPLEERLRPVVGWLLEKRPADRPGSVDAVLAALSAGTGQALAVETAATRESFLQAADLVGRDAELGQLSEMLGATMAGKGGAALVGGESGVGKSRLIDELRARALVDGVVVLRGQAVKEGGPYHAFREVLRGLVLRADVDDFEAGVLAAVVPDIAALLEREVPERAELDPEAAQGRLCAVVEAMLRRHQAPTLIVLEDLQWAGSETLRLCADLGRIAGELPVLLVGTYRDDERPGLPGELPAMRVLKLRRLGAEGIAALAASMLGEPGRRPEVIARLIRETEGNPFFLVEVVRALAMDAGALSRVGSEPMPKTVATGGMHVIVRRRLSQVPAHARPLLDAAAVIGRRIDERLLRRLDPAIPLDAWLETCANVAILEADESSYRFAHDKLREGLLSALPEGDARALHRRIAEAIEAEYAGADEQTAALAFHWGAAGDAGKEAHYSARAGEQALQSSAYREAVAYFERAIALVSGGGPGEGPQGPLGRARAALRPILGAGDDAVGTASDRFRLGTWEGRIAETYSRMSNHTESLRRGARALAYLGRPMPAGPAGLALGLPVQAARRGLMSLLPARFAEPSADARAVLLEATRIQTLVTEACVYTQESLPMLWSGLSMLNLGEPAGPSAHLACGYALMAAVAGIIPAHAMAEAWSKRAMELVEAVGKPYDMAFVLQRVCSYRLWIGEWKVAEEGFDRELVIARKVGDQRMLGDATMCMVFAATYRARFYRVEQLLTELDPWMRKTGDVQLLCGGRISAAYAKLRLGKTREAALLCEEVRPLADASAVSHDDIRCYGVIALTALTLGDRARAREAIEHVLPVIQKTRPVAYWTFDGIAALAEAALGLWEAAASGPPEERAALGKLAQRAVRGAEVYAGVFPIGKPFALLWSGRYAAIAGDAGKARRAWERCLAEAQRMGMPYEQGRAHLELGRLPAGAEPERRGHLEKAAALFAELGTQPDEQRAAEALTVRRG
jgi:serine/threonine protein kinase